MNTLQRAVVVPSESIATINPFLHGHFAEHLGELVYPGVYVGPDSPIPNAAGIRNDVVDALKPLNIPILRWPGGCFADTYHWRDGIGPVETRPKRINVHWGMEEEPNHFGTHEFMAFCKAIGTEPYFAGNVGSATPNELRDWIEYCNFAGDSTLANERRANGADEPFRIKYWGIGNENWGCGGHMTPEEYAGIFRRYSTFAFDYPGSPIERIACGPNDSNWDWTRTFFEKRGWRSPQGFAAHYYCGSSGTATEYTDAQWLELLSKAAALEGMVVGHRAIMDEYDPERKVKLIFDEWGAWHPVEQGKPSGGLYQQNTIRDACVAAISLDVFQNNADKVFMANIAQLINVLQAVLLVDGEHCIKTPTYHVFDLYQPHQGAQAVRFETMAEVISDGGEKAGECRKCYLDKQPFGLRAVQGSASVKNGVLCVTVVNSHPMEQVEFELAVSGGRLGALEAVTLAADDIHAHNTFASPDVVKLGTPFTVAANGNTVRVPMAPGSVLRLMGPLV